MPEVTAGRQRNPVHTICPWGIFSNALYRNNGYPYHNRPAVCQLERNVSMETKCGRYRTHWGSRSFNIFIHLCTSAISFAGSVERPERFPPQIFSNSTIPAVNNDICTASPPHTWSGPLRSDNASAAERTHLIEVRRHSSALVLHIQDMNARPCSVCADRKGRERQRRRLARRRDERPVHRDLQLVVVRVKVRRLIEEQHVLARRVPPYCKPVHKPSAFPASAGSCKRRRRVRWSGTESIHLLSAESSSATMCCSHCWPTNPRSALDLLIEYCRRSHQSRRQPSHKYK